MKNRPKHSHLPFLVTLAGCVLMLAWVDPVKANEVSRQLTSKGFVISQLRKSEVAQVKASRQNFKLILKGFSITAEDQHTFNVHQFGKLHSDYHFIFPHFIKSSLKEELSSWLRRE
ncbi:MAG TPA: hypothetical protein VL651_10575 [Bacteroidia bacterium]|jgi:hypothetical protein|nr:hypothetical protein [Bacteroidia bacterium]